MDLFEAQDLCEHAIVRAGFDYTDFEQDSYQIILFGSAARGMASSESDVDILRVVDQLKDGADKTRVQTDGLDLITLSKSYFSSKEWLGGELASHVSVYGLWVKGDKGSVSFARVSQEAIATKKRIIKSRLQSFLYNLDKLNRYYVLSNMRKIRLDCQRLDQMISNIPVMCSPELDQLWKSLDQSDLYISTILESCDVEVTSIEKFVNLLT
ncbi:nucleotidyltransferase domain-containing protein [Rubritalea spongiae]|uniref:Nucleotidyltransferase domain-containing protein n=1 Tax=Rubritalea spongiae TaxID=430797 RepID=A0ABW5E1U3_9BACT